ncbi:Protein of unknown function [Pyronema omphalodes CBS 100304]|uniref:Uncharacterized protein n=1 Tax=Pyronema omphalodes (strain CBS 100304) TaxID=1076935 RepID=U4L0Q4_PYROM|nr:Protein of unknown function [Pyronema omphalodes CBS 100304]
MDIDSGSGGGAAQDSGASLVMRQTPSKRPCTAPPYRDQPTFKRSFVIWQPHNASYNSFSSLSTAGIAVPFSDLMLLNSVPHNQSRNSKVP